MQLQIGVINRIPVKTFRVRWILSPNLTRLPVQQKIVGLSPFCFQALERINCGRQSEVMSTGGEGGGGGSRMKGPEMFVGNFELSA